MKRALAALSLLLLLAGATAQAEIQRVFNTGSCPDGGSWWSVSTYSGGILMSATGEDCFGRLWQRIYCDGHKLPSDPGITPNVSGSCPGGTGWVASVTSDANGAPTEAIGRDCNGEWWYATYIDAPVSVPGSIRSPGTARPDIPEKAID